MSKAFRTSGKNFETSGNIFGLDIGSASGYSKVPQIRKPTNDPCLKTRTSKIKSSRHIKSFPQI